MTSILRKKFNIIKNDEILIRVILNPWLSVERLKILYLPIHKSIIPFQLFMFPLIDYTVICRKFFIFYRLLCTDLAHLSLYLYLEFDILWRHHKWHFIVIWFLNYLFVVPRITLDSFFLGLLSVILLNWLTH